MELTISNAPDVEYEIVSEFTTQSVDVDLDRVALDFLAPAVEPLLDLRARQDVSRALHQ
jgi:hypothetical protein